MSTKCCFICFSSLLFWGCWGGVFFLGGGVTWWFIFKWTKIVHIHNNTLAGTYTVYHGDVLAQGAMLETAILMYTHSTFDCRGLCTEYVCTWWFCPRSQAGHVDSFAVFVFEAGNNNKRRGAQRLKTANAAAKTELAKPPEFTLERSRGLWFWQRPRHWDTLCDFVRFGWRQQSGLWYGGGARTKPGRPYVSR